MRTGGRRRGLVAGAAVGVLAAAGLTTVVVVHASGTPGWTSSAAGAVTSRPPADAMADSTSAAPTAPGSTAVHPASTTTPAYRSGAEPTFVATDPPVASSGMSVEVTITRAAWDAASHSVQVNGFVSGVDEAGGTCTLTLTRGGSRKTVTGSGSPDATTTSCGLLQMSGTLAAGQWSAVLRYSSAAATGASGPTIVVVP